MRIVYSRSEVYNILWCVLLGGAVLTISYALFFDNKHGLIHILITLCLLVTFSLQYPFTGKVCIGPELFVMLRESLVERMNEAGMQMVAPPQARNDHQSSVTTN